METLSHDSTAARELLDRWGWNSAPQEIVDDAEMYVHAEGKSVGEKIVLLGLATNQEIAAAEERRKEGEEIGLSLYVEHIDRVARNTIRYHALEYGLEFLHISRNYYSIHPKASESAVGTELTKFKACLFLNLDRVPLLAFSSVEGYRRFTGLTGPDLIDSELKGMNCRLAFSDKESIHNSLESVITSTASDDDAVKVVYSATLQEDENLRVFSDIMATALASGASDIHIDVSPQGTPAVSSRVYGEIEKMPVTLEVETYNRIKEYLLRISDAQITSGRLIDPVDGRFQYRDSYTQSINMRCSFIPTPHIVVSGQPAVSISLRLQRMTSDEVMLSDSGLSADVLEHLRMAIRQPQGLILLVGPTNSGKSTTISGMLSEHKSVYGDSRFRVSAEDPVERFIDGVKQFEIPAHRRGKDGFAVISKNFLRHDPDVIFMGEIRDTESAEYAVQYSDTGHLVLSTLHAKTAAGALQRLINVLPSEKPLLREAAIESVILIVGQRLVPTLCGKCKSQPAKPTPKQVKELEYVSRLKGRELKVPETVCSPNPKGCESCKKGYDGLTPVCDVLVMDDELREKLLSPNHPIAKTSKEGVRIRFDEQSRALVEQGIVSWEALLI